MKNGKKTLTLVLALVLMISCFAVGGTLAWLTAEKQTVTNTFVVGDVGALELDETGAANNANQYTIIPGVAITKDPEVTYTHITETATEKKVPVYVFVEIETGSDWAIAGNEYHITKNLDATGEVKTDGTGTATKLMSWTVDTNTWTKLDGVDGVYYAEVAVDATFADKAIIAGDTITVSDKITVNTLDDLTATSLKFNTYAIQKDGFTKADGTADVAAAWTAAKADLSHG